MCFSVSLESYGFPEVASAVLHRRTIIEVLVEPHSNQRFSPVCHSIGYTTRSTRCTAGYAIKDLEVGGSNNCT